MTNSDNVSSHDPAAVDVFQGTAPIVKRSFLSPLRGLPREWKSLVTKCFAALVGLWTIIEAISYLLAADLRGMRVLLVALFLSAILALTHTIYRLWHAVPIAFENESREAQRLAHLQPPLWQYRLAYSLLKVKLATIDPYLADLLDGRAFVELTSMPRFSEYIRWLRLRPDNLIRMMAVAKQLILVDLPRAIVPSDGRAPSPETILRAADRIERLYSDTYQFELGAHRIMPPTKLASIHQIQHTWVRSIRDGVQQVMGFLEQCTDLDPKKSHRIEYEIVFKDPGGIEEFNGEIARLEKLSPSDIIAMELE